MIQKAKVSFKNNCINTDFSPSTWIDVCIEDFILFYIKLPFENHWPIVQNVRCSMFNGFQNILILFYEQDQIVQLIESESSIVEVFDTFIIQQNIIDDSFEIVCNFKINATLIFH